MLSGEFHLHIQRGPNQVERFFHYLHLRKLLRFCEYGEQELGVGADIRVGVGVCVGVNVGLGVNVGMGVKVGVGKDVGVVVGVEVETAMATMGAGASAGVGVSVSVGGITGAIPPLPVSMGGGVGRRRDPDQGSPEGDFTVFFHE